jgi:hypothetical protein
VCAGLGRAEEAVFGTDLVSVSSTVAVTSASVATVKYDGVEERSSRNSRRLELEIMRTVGELP